MQNLTSSFNYSKRPIPEAEYSLFGWARSLEGWALFLFVAGSLFLHGKGQQQSLAVLLGIALLRRFSQRQDFSLGRLLDAPKEVKWYTAWVLWAGITGLFVIINLKYFWADLRLILQMLALVWLAYGVVRMRINILTAVPLAIIFGALIQAGLVVKDFGIDSLLFQTERVSGGGEDPNGLGVRMVFAVFAFPLVWGFVDKARKWLVLAAMMCLPLYGFVVIGSASRKSLLALVFLLGIWIILGSASRKKAALLLRICILGLLLLIISVTAPIIMENTLVGKRFGYFLNKGDGSVETALKEDGRYEMYTQGIKMFIQSPVFGVGIGNFREHYYTGQYSHSDYIEPLATTGLIGFILYKSFCVIILLRVLKLIKFIRDESILYRLKMIMVGIGLIMFLGFGVPFYNDSVVFVLLAVFSVYTSEIERNEHGPARTRINQYWNQKHLKGVMA